MESFTSLLSVNGIIFLFVLFFLLVLSLFVIYYNRFIYLKSLVNEALSGIDVQLKRRHDLIGSLIAVVKGAAAHEKNIIDHVVKARVASIGATTTQEKITAENNLTQAVRSIFALAEQYPVVKANENFLALQKELSVVEHELQLSRRYYNGATRNYNIAVATFPANLLASFFGLFQLPYFEVFQHEKENPKIQL